MGFELMSGFIGLLGTACYYNLQYTITYTHTGVHSHFLTAVAW
jgi:hypothetical protein